jgi:hypothetical protein
MRRRAVLGALAALPVGLAGCTGDLPGATGPRTPPEPSGSPPASGPDLSVSDIEVEEASDGTLRVLATVANRGGRAGTREVVATVTVSGEEHVGSTEVRVSPDATVEARIDFDLQYDAFVADGGVSVEVAG